MKSDKYRHYSKRVNGEISPRIKEPTASRIDNYCRMINKSISSVTELAVNEYLDNHMLDKYLQMDHEELARRCMELERVQDKGEGGQHEHQDQ